MKSESHLEDCIFILGKGHQTYCDTCSDVWGGTDKILHYLPPPFKQEKQDKDNNMTEKQSCLEIFIQENVLWNQPPIHSPNEEKLASKVKWPHYVPYRVLQ